MEFVFIGLWNSGFIAAEYGLPYAGPFTQTFWRYAGLAVVLFVYLTVTGRIQWPGWAAAAPVFCVGILAHAVWLSCSLLSIDHGVPAGIVALVVALQPLLTGALSGKVTGEPTPFFRWVGLGIGFTGVALAVLSRVDLNDSASVFFHFVPLGAVAAMTAATLLQRRMELNRHDRVLPLDVSLFYQSLASAAILIVPAVFIEELQTDWDPAFFKAMLWVIFAVSLFAYSLMFDLIKRIDATRLSSLFFLGPPITMLMGWAFFGDTLEPTDLTGLLIAGIGVALAQQKQKNHLM